MAIGEIKQQNGPFPLNYSISTDNKPCLIGISISQDDFMRLAIPKTEQTEGSNFTFKINSEIIQMGKTFIYQSGQAITDNPITINFPNGAPSSLKVNIVYYKNIE